MQIVSQPLPAVLVKALRKGFVTDTDPDDTDPF